MEWMLQVVDELDDAVGALRQCSIGVRTEIALLLAGGAALMLSAAGVSKLPSPQR